MNSKRGFDRAVDQWLEDGSDATPPEVINAVLLAVRTMPQERDFRVSWRTSSMKQFAYAVAAVAALVVGAAALSALNSPPGVGFGPTAGAEPSRDLGIFEPVAGRIVYADGQGIWGVDPAAPADPATRVRLSSEPGFPLGWSRDGTRLLILRETSDSSGPRGLNGDAQLFVLHADGSETEITERSMGISGATISPDGSRVVFAAATNGVGSALYGADVDGGPVEQLLGPGGHMMQHPTFSPDGTLVAYTSGGGDHSNGVWVMDADGGDAHPIVPNESNEWPGHVRGLAWSPDGDRIAVGLGGSTYTFATDGTQSMRVAGSSPSCTEADPCTRVDMLREVAWPHWSADGSQIAFTAGCLEGVGAANRDGCMLAIADADGSNVREFGYGASGPWHPGTPVNGAGG
jgi:Tol biopolymer transport system component